MNKYLCFFMLTLLSLQVQASLECKGEAFGLNLIYVFDGLDSKNLSLMATTFMEQEIIEEVSGVAKFSSTVKNNGFSAESYYLFVREEGSYSELIAISNNLKSMARSRPMLETSNGNFIKFVCSGSL